MQSSSASVTFIYGTMGQSLIKLYFLIYCSVGSYSDGSPCLSPLIDIDIQLTHHHKHLHERQLDCYLPAWDVYRC